MLEPLSPCYMDLLLYFFNLSWSFHSCTSIWKVSYIILILKIGKSFDSPASFRPTSLISCIINLFKRIIMFRLLFFLETSTILSPYHAGFRPGQSTLDQIDYQCILDGYGETKSGTRTIIATIDFSKTLFGTPLCSICLFPLDSVLTLFDKLNVLFLTGVLAWFFKTT